ncbi:MAG TPA: AtpZ/AtpI family protein [Ilumatobacter sp.]
MKLLLTNIRPGRLRGDEVSSGDDSLGRGMDLALTVLVFLGLGWLLDRWLGLFPLFTISLVVLAATGAFVRMKYVYDATMERLEADRSARRHPAPAGAHREAAEDAT